MLSGVSLTAALIVKDEERALGTCLGSIRDVVDEIVVVDTGSTDRTKDIARQHGARLSDFSWRDDFSAARNHALDLARGDWILYIDADESVRPCRAAELRAQLADPMLIGSYVELHARPGFTAYPELRLFRNDPRIRFRGIIHETIWPAINDHVSARGGGIGQSTLVLDHDGYEGDQQKKHRRNLPLLVRSLRQDPDRVFSLCHLAGICLALGRASLAERAWRIALERVRHKPGHLLAEDSLPYIGLIRYRLAEGRTVRALLREAATRFPHNLQLLWLRGQALMTDKRFNEAAALFQSLIARGETGEFDRSMGYDTRLFGLHSFEALATCHFQLGRFREARRYFELAACADPDNLAYRVKAALCVKLESTHTCESAELWNGRTRS